MKWNLLVLLVLFSGSTICAQSTYVDKKDNTHLWGSCKVKDLKSGEYKEWYDKNYQEYNSSFSKVDAAMFEDFKVKVFIGTWCGDTKYLVPIFIKTWEALGLSYNDLEIIALHNEDELYKQGPNKETKGLNIHRVPTFVFEKDDKEIGRIVERVVFDLDTDMRMIATDQPYHERYRAVTLLNEYMSNTHVDSLTTKNALNEAYKMIRREVSTSSELNTYGYVLKAQKMDQEARFVFDINRYLFRHNPNAKDSYGEILLHLKDYEGAKYQYEEALRIDPYNAHIIKQLASIHEILEELEKEKG